MPVLDNSRHELFAQGLAKGMTQRKAYQAAGYDGADESLDANAARLIASDKVALRVAELQTAIAKEAEITQADVLAGLMRNEALARDHKQMSAAIRALELVGKQMGMFVDRKEIGAPGEFAAMSDAELHKRVLEMVESVPSLRAVLDSKTAETSH